MLRIYSNAVEGLSGRCADFSRWRLGAIASLIARYGPCAIIVLGRYRAGGIGRGALTRGLI